MDKFAYVGCRTSEWRGARGKGIEVYHIDDSGNWHHIQRVISVQENPSWLTLDKKRNRLYVLHGDGNQIAIFARNPLAGTLTLVSEQTTGPQNAHPDLDPLRRNNPVHAALTPDGHHLLIANHEGGNVAALPFADDDTLLAPDHLALVEGHAHSDEAPSLSRPHEIIFAPNSDFYALPIQGRQAGNGIDMVRIYQWRGEQSLLNDEVLLPAGTWPRHVDFHPTGNWLYSLSELGNTITVFDFDRETGNLTLKETHSSLPEGFEERSDASEIEVHPSGRFLYAANRGHNSIAVFRIDQLDGSLTPQGWVHCGGNTPRFTTISADGKRFYSANEDSDTIRIFSINEETGMLTYTGKEIVTASPTCIVFSS
ncbi:lactonase family protein (plasmid) [Pantoea agglomerans]|nr:lactonase family protein [Pantoea agglomerans]WIL43996.1 lactonase family protein [Pantoea agglomerans]